MLHAHSVFHDELSLRRRCVRCVTVITGEPQAMDVMSASVLQARRVRRLRRQCRAVLAAGAFAVSAAPVPANELADLSLEQLLDESVTSVSRREQRLTDVATAVTVLGADELQRLGATSLGDALRTVPGMNVAAVSASQWAISARGFNNLYANKLLVQIDGRAVYTPLFAGVFWDQQQPMLADVERIEVIRGPGATIWGANAVNGVISVVGRDARDTQGALVYGAGGDVDRGGGGRYGGRLGADTWYRVFSSVRRTDDYALAGGRAARDGWDAWHGGWRIDDHSILDTQLTWQADATVVNFDAGTSDGYNVNTLARWTRHLPQRSGFDLQLWYDRTDRYNAARARSMSDTVDLSFTHRLGLGERNDLVWGLGYRAAANHLGQTVPEITVTDGEFGLQLFSAFVQNEFRPVPERWTVTAGVKLEHNDFTGFEVQPSVRAAFKPRERETWWAAVSRAVRTPSALEGRDMMAVVVAPPFTGPGGGSYVPTLRGNPDLRAEVLWAYELGYRVQAGTSASVDVATFYNDYADVVDFGGIERLEAGASGEPGTAELRWVNAIDARTWGGEIAAVWRPAAAWRLTTGYALLVAQVSAESGAAPVTVNRQSPRQQANLGASYGIGRRAGCDAQLRYVGELRAVPAFTTADLRLWHRPHEQVELSVTGRNLLDARHPEQAQARFAITSEVPRSVQGKVVWRF